MSQRRQPAPSVNSVTEPVLGPGQSTQPQTSQTHPTHSQPTLAQLRALLLVAGAGGFGEAAAEAGVSQSSLSEAVSKLETAVGRPLLRRTPGGTVPTAAGLRVLVHARAAVQAAADVLLAAQDEGALSGRLRLSSFRSTATHLLPPALSAFRSLYPGVTVMLLDSEAQGGSESAVRAGRVDLSVVVGRQVPGLLLTPLAEDEYLYVAPESRGLHPVSWADLAAAPMILPPHRDPCFERVRGYLEAHAIALTDLMEVEQDSVTLSMVRYGLGITVMPRLALSPLPSGLIALPLPEPLARPLSLAVLPQRAGLPLVRAFTRVLLDSVQAQAALTLSVPEVVAPGGKVAERVRH
ncbi:LysR family transcriptional regulator [Deinococcus aquatilis]|jgi:DNA-binding transcriptional LysR family regulator|uniref:LysR family transcriptional regulator n=1 Tax=Deinococcus aquatilis TaxID=519440 RepID=UPI00036F292D|nr:LysR family transcriptional regulator [Deinococcus aquatilis]